ncbi:MAG: TetR/AcrR family transcriptional regulator [Pseudomonadota bacterium]
MADEQIKERRDSYHHGDLRGALIRATRQLIEEKGRDHFSVSDACRLAGVSTAAPYKHFKSKEEMVTAAVVDAMDRHQSGLLEDLSHHKKGTRQRITAMGRNYVTFALSEPGMFQLRFQKSDEGAPPAEIEQNGADVYGLVQEEVRAALGEPEINERVIERSYLLWCFVHGLSYLSMVPELANKAPSGSLDDLLASIADRVLAA